MTLKVLTIDDDSSMTELLGVLLQNHGMEVISSGNGTDGIDIALKEKPDLIILDLLLPGTDGWQVCKTLRTFTSAPVIILSSLDDPATISQALDAGADDYITKPLSSKVLMAHIKNLTRRHMVENNSATMMRQVAMTNLATRPTNLP